MVYYSNAARMTARNRISHLMCRLATTIPGDDIPQDDIRDLLYYLRVLDDELDYEMRCENAKILRDQKATKKSNSDSIS